MYLRCKVLIIILTHHFISLNKMISRLGNTQRPTHGFIPAAHKIRLKSKFKKTGKGIKLLHALHTETNMFNKLVTFYRVINIHTPILNSL